MIKMEIINSIKTLNEMNFKNIGASALNYALCFLHYALIKLVSVALSFCTAARNIRHLPRKSVPGMLLPSVAAGRGSARLCSGAPCLSGGGAGLPCRYREDKREGRNNPTPADCSVPPSWSGTYNNVHGSGSSSGGQAHRREGRASP